MFTHAFNRAPDPQGAFGEETPLWVGSSPPACSTPSPSRCVDQRPSKSSGLRPGGGGSHPTSPPLVEAHSAENPSSNGGSCSRGLCVAVWPPTHALPIGGLSGRCLGWGGLGLLPPGGVGSPPLDNKVLQKTPSTNVVLVARLQAFLKKR